MAIHPLNDRLKIKVDADEFDLNDKKSLIETGIVVEIPDNMLYLSFHNFGFEDSIANENKLEKILTFYNQMLGKRVYWEKLQDSGRHIKEEDGEYIYLQMTDVLAYADKTDEKAEVVNSLSSSGSFNLE